MDGGVSGGDLSGWDASRRRCLRQKIVDLNGGTGCGALGGRGRAAGACGQRRCGRADDDRGQDDRRERRFAGSGATRTRSPCRWSTPPVKLHLLDKLTLASVTVENTSLMPADYATRLTASDLDNLVEYISARCRRAI
jgi:hypothetical protein